MYCPIELLTFLQVSHKLLFKFWGLSIWKREFHFELTPLVNLEYATYSCHVSIQSVKFALPSSQFEWDKVLHQDPLRGELSDL